MLLWTLIIVGTVGVLAALITWLSHDPPLDPHGTMTRAWRHEQRQNRDR